MNETNYKQTVQRTIITILKFASPFAIFCKNISSLPLASPALIRFTTTVSRDDSKKWNGYGWRSYSESISNV